MAVAETTGTTQVVHVRQGRSRRDRWTPLTFVLPAVFVILFLSLFPLVISLYVSLVRLQFVSGNIQLNFVGLDNYAKLLVGINQKDFLGVFGTPNLEGWLVIGAVAIALFYWLALYARGAKVTLIGLIGRVLLAFCLV